MRALLLNLKLRISQVVWRSDHLISSIQPENVKTNTKLLEILVSCIFYES